MDVKSCVVTYVNIVVVFAPGAKMAAIAGDDAAQTIFPTGITWGTSHTFSFSL
jgi:hypothetical protein